MNSILAKIALFLAIVVFIVAATYVFVVQNVSSDIATILKEVDHQIALNHFQYADHRLMQVAKKKLTSYDWLRIIKRAYDIAIRTNDYGLLEKISKKAVKSLPGAEELWAFYVKALIEQKKYKEASDLSERHLKSNKFNSIRAEALLLYSHDGDLSILEEKLKSSNDPETYLQIAYQLKNPILFYDAALLFLERGQKDRARQLLPLMRSDITPSLGVATIAYDSMSYSDALHELQQSDSSVLVPYNAGVGQVSISDSDKEAIYQSAIFLEAALTADTLLQVSDHYGAYEAYLKANSINSRRSWEIWQNIAILGEELNSAINIEEHYNSALLNFPQRKELTLALASRMLDRAEGAALVSKFLEIAPFDPEANIFWIKYFDENSTPEYRSFHLWDIFNSQHTANKRLSQYMIWFFLGIKNYSAPLIVIDRYSGADRSWIATYQALIEATQGSQDHALQIFNNLGDSSWHIPFNMALIYIDQGNYRMALSLLTRAELLFKPSGRELQYDDLSSILSKKGLAYIAMNQNTLAVDMAERALAINENNMEALRILRDSAYI